MARCDFSILHRLVAEMLAGLPRTVATVFTGAPSEPVDAPCVVLTGINIDAQPRRKAASEPDHREVTLLLTVCVDEGDLNVSSHALTCAVSNLLALVEEQRAAEPTTGHELVTHRAQVRIDPAAADNPGLRTASITLAARLSRVEGDSLSQHI